MAARRPIWTNKSVRLLNQEDPIREVISRAQHLALGAMESGWKGPPFDPIKLASHLQIAVFPSTDVADARTVPLEDGSIRIEYNPMRPKARSRYSVAHEIAHTLFPDCADRIRHRMTRADMRLDDWQLEMLCNIGAAELLMPIGSLSSINLIGISIDAVLELRKAFEVSVEAVLLRLVKLIDEPCVMFAASCAETGPNPRRYVIDYSVNSHVWQLPNLTGMPLPEHSTIEGCTGIGYTSKGTEAWPAEIGKVRIESVGVQPHPDRMYPRVVGLARPLASIASQPHSITYLKGDATAPVGSDLKIIAHIVNDKASLWGGGFALAVRKKWKEVQRDFQQWAAAQPSEFLLGNVHFTPVAANLSICHMIGQRGYGPSPSPRIRYQALRKCLTALAHHALNVNGSVHMPRIGCGEAGGTWEVVQELIRETLCHRGVPVAVYDLPNQPFEDRAEPHLFQVHRG